MAGFFAAADFFDLVEVLVDAELTFAVFFSLADVSLADAEFDFAAAFLDAVVFFVVFFAGFFVVLSVKPILLTGRPVLRQIA